MKLKYRKHVRLPHFDYASSGYYFVTLCTKNREEVFAPAVDPKCGRSFVVAASHAACDKVRNTRFVEKIISDLEVEYYENLAVDFYCVMSNHIHVILSFEDPVYRKGAIGSRSYKLDDIIRALKSLISRDLGFGAWQPNYYEHIIRSEGSLNRIRNYILANPDTLLPDWEFLDPRG